MKKLGKAYVTLSGNITCRCRYKKCNDLTKQAKQGAYRKFWAIGKFNEQNTFLLIQVKSTSGILKGGVKSKPRGKTRT